MFERFTDRARRVVVLAQEEARMLDHNYIGTEHILLGIVHLGEGAAAKALDSLGISLDGARQQVEEIIGRGKHAPSGHIPFTPRAKKVLELSLRESLQLGNDYIGTEHILLGLLREGEGVAAQVLVRLGADLNRVRQQVILVVEEQQGEQPRVRPARRGPLPPTSRFPREQEIFLMLTDISSRLHAIEEHLGLRPSPEREQGGRAVAAEPREAESGGGESGDAGPGGGESGDAGPGGVASGEAGSGAEPGEGQDSKQD